MKLTMGSLLVLALLGTEARADDGVYISAMVSFGAPSVKTTRDLDGDRLRSSRFRSAIGYRHGAWAIEPTLALVSVGERNYAMETTTTVYDFAAAGAQGKYLWQQGAGAWYARLGATRSWSGAAIGRPSQHGGGIEGGVGYQLGQSAGRGAGGFFADVAYDVTWIGPRESDADRISTVYFSLGFGAGTGY